MIGDPSFAPGVNATESEPLAAVIDEIVGAAGVFNTTWTRT